MAFDHVPDSACCRAFSKVATEIEGGADEVGVEKAEVIGADESKTPRPIRARHLFRVGMRQCIRGTENEYV